MTRAMIRLTFLVFASLLIGCSSRPAPTSLGGALGELTKPGTGYSPLDIREETVTLSHDSTSGKTRGYALIVAVAGQDGQGYLTFDSQVSQVKLNGSIVQTERLPAETGSSNQPLGIIWPLLAGQRITLEIEYDLGGVGPLALR